MLHNDARFGRRARNILWENIGSASCSKSCYNDSEHVRTAGQMIAEKEDARISAIHGRQRPKSINAERDTRAFGQGYMED